MTARRPSLAAAPARDSSAFVARAAPAAMLAFLLAWGSPTATLAQSPGTTTLEPVPMEVEPGEPFRQPSAEVLQTRRAHLREALGEGVALLPSASQRDLEGEYPQDSDFRQRNDFFYLTGLETPDSWLLLGNGGDGRPTEVLFVPGRSPEDERWTGPRPSLAEAGRISGIRDVRPVGELGSAIGLEDRDGLASATVLHLPGTRRDRANPTLQRLASGATLVRPLDPSVHRLRQVKDRFELEMLRRAIDITVGAHRAAMRAAAPGMYEYELEAIIEFNFRLGGAERVGFPSIVGSGPNSVILHYDKNRRRMESGDLVVIDIGAEYSYYTADVTRTLPVSGRFTPRQRRVYELVLGAQQAAIDAVRPGVTVRQLDGIARTWLRANAGDACGVRTCDAYFVHGLSHWLGMDVHDVGDYGRPLEPGMVLTIEPGIYLPNEHLGVRIEDDVLVTEDGHEVLSDGAPRDPDEIEALMAGGATAP